MNSRVKAKWLAALRSGGYLQGREGALQKDSRFCCLGVLCDIAVEEGVVEQGTVAYLFTTWNAAAGRGSVTTYGVEKAQQFLPTEVIEWAELKNDENDWAYNPTVHVADSYTGVSRDTTLADLNDNPTEEYNFEEIAKVIEDEL